jgi:nucleoside 2-deoxyribosyltransferase
MKKTKPLYYLASPYTHSDETIKKGRARAVTEAAVKLLKLGVFTFAPIAYNEPWERHDLPGDWGFWCDFDKSFVERCDAGLIVLMLDGWDRSVGVTAEIEFAKELGYPVYYCTQEQVNTGDLSFLLSEQTKQKSLFCEHSKM